MAFADSAMAGPFPDRLRLPMRFDPIRLRADLDAVDADWIAHFVTDNYEGDWSALPLRGPAGETHPIRLIYPDPMATGYADGPLLARTPYFRELLARFACPLQIVRLMRLTPGSIIKEHTDFDLSAESGSVRIHVPIVTGPRVEFLLNRTPVSMAPGEAWYLRLSDPHAVANRGDEDRVHLVIDATMNDWLAGLFRRADAPAAA